jgi:hypothetical protein
MASALGRGTCQVGRPKAWSSVRTVRKGSSRRKRRTYAAHDELSSVKARQGRHRDRSTGSPACAQVWKVEGHGGAGEEAETACPQRSAHSYSKGWLVRHRSNHSTSRSLVARRRWRRQPALRSCASEDIRGATAIASGAYAKAIVAPRVRKAGELGIHEDMLPDTMWRLGRSRVRHCHFLSRFVMGDVRLLFLRDNSANSSVHPYATQRRHFQPPRSIDRLAFPERRPSTCLQVACGRRLCRTMLSDYVHGRCTRSASAWRASLRPDATR